jgi:hypothetical protein
MMYQGIRPTAAGIVIVASINGRMAETGLRQPGYCNRMHPLYHNADTLVKSLPKPAKLRKVRN